MKSYSLAHMSRHTPRRLSKSHTRRGPAIRRLIIGFIATCPRPPSLREIGEAVGLSSSSTVWGHVRTLREEGRIAPAKLGQPRAILLADPGPSEVELLRERVRIAEGCHMVEASRAEQYRKRLAELEERVLELELETGEAAQCDACGKVTHDASEWICAGTAYDTDLWWCVECSDTETAP